MFTSFEPRPSETLPVTTQRRVAKGGVFVSLRLNVLGTFSASAETVCTGDHALSTESTNECSL
jgi:hypothetical protein